MAITGLVGPNTRVAWLGGGRGPAWKEKSKSKSRKDGKKNGGRASIEADRPTG